MLVDGAGDVAVVVVVEGEIPVAAVEAGAVGEDLESFAWTVVWLAVCSTDRVVAADVFGLKGWREEYVLVFV